MDQFYYYAKKDSYYSYCRECDNKKRRERHANGGRARKRAYYLKNRDSILEKERLRSYGVTPEQYADMLNRQGGVCAICKEVCTTREKLCVDHDHATGEVRGLLCVNHNAGIGYFHDSPSLLRAAADYLETLGYS